MMKKTENHTAPDDDGDASQSWDALHDRIRTLALRKSEAMLGAYAEEEEFDRSARSLRMLMSAAEVAGRMKREEEKEAKPHDQAPAKPAVTEERIAEVYREIERGVDRFEEREAKAADRRRDSEAGLSGAGGKTVEAPCA
ncbi:hypothetical protein PUV54_03015 [Hyphococcus flavus]|uniref:Uncharacterized protein n=1 Tax=Hyphococcus flavus TaxID=1866326 RepID=A0AAE9ZCU4_9PROT|nr:hypothetical protein [Hyphococcus flavus]WDI32161.1 hypothetical protein PUV54_03015 [Hyphococcus flavus]